MQVVAQDWLVLQLTDRALPLGVNTALQFLPVLLFGLWSGVVADRFEKRRILFLTQGLMGVLALVLGLLTLGGAAELWMVYLLAFLLGCATALDNPARQSFMSELVAVEDLPSVIALNSASFNLARIVGPALAGVVVSLWGVSPAFFLNALSFGAVLLALALMDPREIIRSHLGSGASGGVGEGLRYIWKTRGLRAPLLLIAVVATLGINFRVVIPVLARFAFEGGPHTYGLLAALFAGGGLLGALGTAAFFHPSYRLMVVSAAVFGLCSLGAALAPSLFWECAALLPVGATSMSFLSTGNSLLQMQCLPEMRGRVMSLYAVILLGGTPIGGALVGWLSEVQGPRAGLYLAAASGVGGALLAARKHLFRRNPPGS
jgi:MFS family permease